MKIQRALVLSVLSIFLIELSMANNLEYNFEVKDGKNTLVVKKTDSQSSSKRSNRIIKNKKHRSKKNSSTKNSKNLSKMVKLGVLIDRITDRLSKNSKKKSLQIKKNKSTKSDRKAFIGDLGGGESAALMGGVGALAVVGGGLMAGAADNANLEAQIDKLKMEQAVLQIKVDTEEEMNDIINRSARGFATMKVRANCFITNFGQKLGIAEDNIEATMGMIDSIFDHVEQIKREGKKDKPEG